jgi:hypothetical protein
MPNLIKNPLSSICDITRKRNGHGLRFIYLLSYIVQKKKTELNDIFVTVNCAASI